MFEREVMVGTLRRQNDTLTKLIHEIESKPRSDWQESQYYRESLKKIETALRRVRRMDEEDASYSASGLQLKYQSYPLRMRDIS